MTFLDVGLGRTAAANKANCSTRTIDRAIKDGDLAAYRVGREVTILPEDLAQWIQTKKIKPVAKLGRPRRSLRISPRRATL